MYLSLTVILYVDGGTRGSVISLVDPKRKKKILKRRRGKPTNNELEYLAIIYGLEYIGKYYPRVKVILKSDSMLAVKQITNRWKVNGDNLRILNRRVEHKKTRLISVSWTPRENNLAGIYLEDLKDMLK